jgi:hypothetical protein
MATIFKRLVVALIAIICLSSDSGAFWHGAPVGLIGTRAKVDGNKSGGITKAMFRSAFYLPNGSTTIQFLEGCFYVASGVETGPGSSCVITESVEYNGTCTPVKFSGSSTGTIPNNGTLLSDPVTLSAPAGALAFRRQYQTNSSGVTYQWDNSVNFIDTSLGDASVTSSPTDQTVACGALTDSGTIGIHAPLAIIGPLNQPGVCVVGDSIAYGSQGTFDATGDIGIIEPSLGTGFAWTNISSSGDQAVAFVAGHSNRSLVFPYCSTAIIEYGRNDIYASPFDTAAQLETNLTTIYGYFGSNTKTIIETTLIPDTPSSTDEWETTANQSTQAPYEGYRQSFNSALRAGTFGPSGGYFDTASVIGTPSPNYQFWIVNGTPYYCTYPQSSFAGVHPSPTCYGIVASSGIIDTTRIQWLLNRDLDPASNDNSPAFLRKAA